MRRLARGERKDEQRSKSPKHPPEGPEKGNSPGTTARVEHKELKIALGKLTPTSQEKKKEPNKCKRKPANERKHKISNFIHTRKTYIAQELGDSRMARKVYCSESPKHWPLSVQSKCSKRVRSVSSNHVLRDAPLAFANMSNLNQVVCGSCAVRAQSQAIMDWVYWEMHFSACPNI